MKVHTEYLTFHTRKHREYLHIMPQVEAIVNKSGVREGMVLVSAMHITAGLYVNDDEPGLIHDIDEWLEKLAPFRQNYRHHATGETNGDSHLKSLLVRHQVIVPVTKGKLEARTIQWRSERSADILVCVRTPRPESRARGLGAGLEARPAVLSETQ